MTYDYFYGQQAEMFAFYRVPKVLFTEDGDNYVEPQYTGMEERTYYHNISDEIDRISFELELEDKQKRELLALIQTAESDYVTMRDQEHMNFNLLLVEKGL